jgi:RimJ/RimL family protein N-acetyltransferase
MPHRKVTLKPVDREDVARIRKWLQDDEVAESWFGRYSYGNPAHLGYHPDEMEGASDETWERVFSDPEHRMLSIYLDDGEHIGEVHVAIEESLGDGHISVLIGSQQMWHHGHGTVATRLAMRLAFEEWGLYRLWVDVPEYNAAAMTMFEHLGFVHEGTLRKSRPHEGARFDSVIMGILATEYAAHEAGAG